MDTYNQELNKQELSKLTCNICHKQFGSQKIMKLHKKYCHSRLCKSTPNESVKDFKIEYDLDLKGIKDVIDMRGDGDEYLVSFLDGHLEWMSLPDELEEVKDFKDFIRLYEQNTIQEVTDFDEWIKNDYIID